METLGASILGITLAKDVTKDASGTPTATFESHQAEVIECPICHRRQMPNRISCYCCGCKFSYQDDMATV